MVNTKKTLAFFLALLALVALIPSKPTLAAAPEADFAFDPFTGTITGYLGDGGGSHSSRNDRGNHRLTHRGVCF